MLEDLIKAAILGTIQGLTEFLPVSSTGHLIIAERVLGVDDERYGLVFDTSIHMGTLTSLLVFYGARWLRLFDAGVAALRARSLDDPEGRLAWMIALATVPAAAVGFFLENQIQDAFRSPWTVATMLIAFSFIFLLAERVGRRTRDLGRVTPLDAILVGCAQAFALIPGVSRSGATISAGLMAQFQRTDAANFAFLMSAPIIAGAGLANLTDLARDIADGKLGGNDIAFFATGFVFAAAVGYAAIRLLMRFLVTNTLLPFVYYRIAFGLAIFAVLLWDR